MTLDALTSALLDGRGFAHKRDISDAMLVLQRSHPAASAVMIGDDCAAIPDGDGYLLFAMEGLVDDFVESMPWFSGYCGVMVNVNDIYAMGGRPLAVVDAIWSAGTDASRAILEGMADASSRYGVPIVGGHTNHRSARSQLAVAILGRAKRLLTSFDARPGQRLLMAIDLRGGYEEPHPYWNASTSSPAERLRADLEILPRLAEDGLCQAAKDISMAGAIGTALMLLECSAVGAHITIDDIPRPAGVPVLRWLQSFPSFGFVLSVDQQYVDEVSVRFDARGIACADIGAVTAAPQVWLESGAERSLLWDVAQEPFILAPKATVQATDHA
jgi:AIR synthase-related protein